MEIKDTFILGVFMTVMLGIGRMVIIGEMDGALL